MDAVLCFNLLPHHMLDKELVLFKQHLVHAGISSLCILCDVVMINLHRNMTWLCTAYHISHMQQIDVKAPPLPSRRLKWCVFLLLIMSRAKLFIVIQKCATNTVCKVMPLIQPGRNAISNMNLRSNCIKCKKHLDCINIKNPGLRPCI